jgi:hypothetical protein
MVSGIGSGGAVSMLTQLYRSLDTNKDSSLTKDELLSALTGTDSASTTTDAESLASQTIDTLDSDGDGAISATEFTSFADQFDYETSSALLTAQEQSGTPPPPPESSSESDSSGTETEAVPPPPPPPPPAAENEDTSSETTSSDSTTDSTSSTTQTAGSGGSSESYDPLDTNKDGMVSAEERAAAQTASGINALSGKIGGQSLAYLLQTINAAAA